ncbi:hypothetical protein BDD12DRAFT_925309 [Trichophaea hybrida]|nr:hypothetical protein BDD12DRAFT_925309 [Trichophaea hybrida]
MQHYHHASGEVAEGLVLKMNVDVNLKYTDRSQTVRIPITILTIAPSSAECSFGAAMSRAGLLRSLLLLDRGADIEARDTYSCTVLHWAVQYHSKVNVQQLLDRGTNIKAGNNYGATVLHLASV